MVLTDVLDRQLDQLDDPAHRAARALAVADRRLALPVLVAVTGLDEDVLVACLRDLDRRHLLATSDGSPHVQLKHPLLAEAVRRRLVAGEAAVVHRKLAEVMSDAARRRSSGSGGALAGVRRPRERTGVADRSSAVGQCALGVAS